MITVEKLRIYKKYNGDADGFARVGKSYEKGIFDFQDWSLIDNIMQNIEMIKSDLCSKEFIKRTLLDLDVLFDPSAKNSFLKYCDFTRTDNE